MIWLPSWPISSKMADSGRSRTIAKDVGRHIQRSGLRSKRIVSPRLEVDNGSGARGIRPNGLRASSSSSSVSISASGELVQDFFAIGSPVRRPKQLVIFGLRGGGENPDADAVGFPHGPLLLLARVKLYRFGCLQSIQRVPHFLCAAYRSGKPVWKRLPCVCSTFHPRASRNLITSFWMYHSGPWAGLRIRAITSSPGLES